jgi:twitching motility protein PilT
MPRIDKYLALAVSERASDVHFSSEEPTRMRIDGDLISLDEKPWSNESLKGMLFEILNQDEQEKLITTKNFDKSYVVPGTGFFRVNMYWTRRGISAVLRAIPYQIPSFGDLGAPDVLRKLADAPKGLILVTGPTGSGKSTTLAAMINHINQTFSYHILTAEDPVEFVHKSKKSLINLLVSSIDWDIFALDEYSSLRYISASEKKKLLLSARSH